MVFSDSGITNVENLNGVNFTSIGAVVHFLSVSLPSGTLELSTTKLYFKDHPIYKRFKKMYANQI